MSDEMKETIAEGQETEQSQEASEQEEESVAEFVGDGEEEKSPSSEEEEEQHEKVETKEDKKPPEKKELSETEKRLERLEKENKRLGYELRKSRKAVKKEEKSEEVLSDDQIKAIIKEHSNDPEVMLNVSKYISEQAAKRQVDVTEEALIRREADKNVYQRWPDLADEASDLSQRYEEIVPTLRLDGHPMQRYLTMCSMVTEGLPGIKQAEYERGKADGLAEKAEKKRHESVKKDTLTPSGKKAVPSDSKKLTSSQAESLDRLGLTPAQRKIAAGFMTK
jgi:hypothetical protein